jgi:hypothetical protein
VLSTHRTVCHGRTRSLPNGSGRSDCYCAVDDRQSRLEHTDVSRSFTDKIFNLEWEADMEDIDALHWLRGGRDVYTDDFVTSGNQLEEGLADLSKPDNDRLRLVHQLP